MQVGFICRKHQQAVLPLSRLLPGQPGDVCVRGLHLLLLHIQRPLDPGPVHPHLGQVSIKQCCGDRAAILAGAGAGSTASSDSEDPTMCIVNYVRVPVYVMKNVLISFTF